MNSLSARSISQHRHRLLFRLSFSTSSSSPTSSPSYSSHFHRRSDEESRSVRVSVWWDIENCSPPSGANVYKIAHSITSAVRFSGIKGPVQINAFGDVLRLSKPTLEALSATGVALNHVPQDGKNSADRFLIVDLLQWVSQNPAPAHLFLISGDRDFAGILHRLRMSNYNILLACPADRAPSVLCSAASIMWYWNTLVKGENFTGKYFNQPPDGPYNSWYGHYKGVLEDPYAVVPPPAASQAHNISASEPVSKTEAVPAQQLRPVPREVVRKLRTMLSSFPKGIPISSFGSLVVADKIIPDKNFYGHKTFSRFLLSKPNIVKLKPQADGQFLVFPHSHQAFEPAQCSTHSKTEDPSVTKTQKVEPYSPNTEPLESISDGENHNSAASSTSKALGSSVTTTRYQKSPLSSPLDADEKKKKSEMVFEKGRYAEGKEECNPLTGELPNGETSVACAIDEHVAPVRNQDAESERGYFRKIWSTWFKNNDVGSSEKTKIISDDIQASIPQALNSVQSHAALDSHPSSENAAFTDAKVDAETVNHGYNSDQSQGFFRKILNWFKLWRKDPDGNISNDSIEKSNQIKSSPRDDVFLMDSFWNDIESFLNSYKGSKIIWNSKTREEIAQSLRKEGPLVIQPLDDDNLLDLIDLLISEKKWIEERPLSASPFRVVQPMSGNAESAQSNNPSQLRSVYLGSPSLSDKVSEQQDKGKILFNTKTKPCRKTKEEVLADCKKLLEEMFNLDSGAIKIGQFKKVFVERYGYMPDHGKLGYPKLRSLLQTIPDLKVGLNFVYPDSKVKDKQANAGVGKGNDEEKESPWEELGPVNSSVPSRKEVKVKSKGGEYRYESPLSEDETSDSEEEEKTRRMKKESSSLLQILDSWYLDENNNQNGKHKIGNVGQCGTALSKQRPGKSYSFVSDVDGENKDKLIDGILSSFHNKSGEQKISN